MTGDARLVAGRRPESAAVVGVVIPFRDSAATIGMTIDSIVAQTERRWHAVLVDDGSTDEGPAIVRARVAREPRLALLRKTGGGVASARNAGRPLVRAAYVHHMDADDWLEPDAYATLLALAASARTDGAMGSYRFVDAEGGPIDECRITRGSIDTAALFRNAPAWLPSMIVRADRDEGVAFDDGLVGYEDLDFFLRLAERGARWTTTPRIVATYRISPGSLSKRSGEMLGCVRRVLDGAVARARRDGRRVSERAAARTVRQLALAYATRCVLLGGAVDEAASMYGDAAAGRITPGDAATAVVHGLMTGLGCSIAAARAQRETWMPPIGRWWRRAVAEGWAGAGLETRASLELVRRMVEPREVCAELLRGAGRRITVIGFGRNGTALAESALARGLSIAVRDDRFDAEPSRARTEMPPGVRVEPMAAPLDASSHVIVTPLRDARLLARLGRRAVHDRWRAAMRRLAERDGLLRSAA